MRSGRSVLERNQLLEVVVQSQAAKRLNARSSGYLFAGTKWDDQFEF